MKSLICVPTYNEADNITPLVVEVFRHSLPNTEVLVVDDNSPDGTGLIVEKLRPNYPRLHLLKREKKSGLAGAYLAAFQWALERNYDWVFEMDADFSHNPEYLPSFFTAIARGGYDGILGSRYVEGGGISNWSRPRLLLSRCGSLYARFILRYPLRDWTGGFNAWSTRLLRALDLSTIESKGYAFQIELKYRSLILGYQLIEIPIVFEERRLGESKMSGSIVREAIGGVLKMKMRY